MKIELQWYSILTHGEIGKGGPDWQDYLEIINLGIYKFNLLEFLNCTEKCWKVFQRIKLPMFYLKWMITPYSPLPPNECVSSVSLFWWALSDTLSFLLDLSRLNLHSWNLELYLNSISISLSKLFLYRTTLHTSPIILNLKHMAYEVITTLRVHLFVSQKKMYIQINSHFLFEILLNIKRRWKLTIDNFTDTKSRILIRFLSEQKMKQR